MLIALAGGVGVLLLLGVFAASPFGRTPRGAAVARGGSLAAAAVLVALALAALAAGRPPEALTLPLGPVGGRVALALDGLSVWFLLPVAVAGAAGALGALGDPPRDGEASLPLLLAGLALSVAAAGGAAMLCGLGLVFLAATGAARPGAERHAAAGGGAAPALAATGLLCLAAAFGLLGGVSAGFDAPRASPPEGWRAAALPFLALAGTGALAAVAAPRSGDASGPLLAAAPPVLAVYVLARLVPDLGGPAQPSWWGLPLLAGGGAGAVASASRAVSAEEMDGVLAAAGRAASALAAMALGAALVFRGADLGALAALAAGGALLLAAGAGLAVSALALVAAAVARGAGGGRLDRLGGLARLMPSTAVAALLAAGTLALLPLLPGFAGGWALLQALVAGWRLGGVLLPLCCAGALVLAVAATAILAAAMVRFLGVAFLGRPRTPRGAGAGEAGGAARWAPLLPAVLLVPLGLLPGWALAAGAPALAAIVGRAPPPTRGAGLALAEGGAAYAPLLLAALLALVVFAMAALAARLVPAAGEPGGGSAWDGGFLEPPPHLPFGDPSTQPGAAGIAEPLLRFLPAPRGAPAVRGARVHRALAGLRGAVLAAGGFPRRGGAALGGGVLALAAALAALALAGAG